MTGWSDHTLRAIAGVVTAHAGLAFPASRIGSAETGIRRAMARAGITQAARYLTHILSDPDHLEPLLAELTIGETYLFRQPAHFDLITTRILPDLRLRHGARHVARIWSAGCASGEEAYSLAIMLDDARAGGRVLGTDVCETALARARAAEYRRWSLRGTTSATVARVLHRRGQRWVMNDRYRRMVTFARHNLAGDHYPPKPAPLSPFDLILCRNVLIYFDAQTIARVASGLVGSLADGGWLLTGPHDPPLLHPELVSTTIGESFVYRREIRDHSSTPDSRPAAAFGASWETRTGADSGASVGDNRTGTSDVKADPTCEAARAAFAAGRYDDALRLTSARRDEQGAVFHVHVLASAHGSAAALTEVDSQLCRHPMSAPLHLLKALLLVDLRRIADARVSLRHTLYLDPASAIANALLRDPLAPPQWLPGVSHAGLTQTDREAIGPEAAETA